MLVVISPAKRLDFETPVTRQQVSKPTQPDFLDDAEQLITTLRGYTPRRLTNLMGISAKLSQLNAQRYKEFSRPFNATNARPAVLAFKGDVYLGLEAESLSAADLTWAQKKLRILSGLYGVLRPLDLMQAYRLEMGTRLKNTRGKDLYSYWGEQVTAALNASFAAEPAKLRESEGNVLLNLASNEYFGVVQTDALEGRVVNVTFKDMNKGKYKVLSFFAKKARGYMTRYVITNRITSVAQLREFDVEGYRYSAKDSSAEELVFLRNLETSSVSK